MLFALKCSETGDNSQNLQVEISRLERFRNLGRTLSPPEREGSRGPFQTIRC
jgi:hypothetical protein